MEVLMQSPTGKTNGVRLSIEGLEGRETPSSFTLNIGDSAHASAVLTMQTGADANGAIVGHAAPQSGVDGTIPLGTANQ
jgi:hypothetical protein